MEKENPAVANVYKTSKTTWILLGFLGVIAVVVIFMIMRKKKTGEAGIEEAGAVLNMAPPIV
jgi:flagellar basal body-associated protein FliL